MIRTYSELSTIESFEDRFDYLQLKGAVGRATFGFDRYLNQRFYTSREWKDVRNAVIARDLGLDLGVPGYEIHQNIIVHHMNPMAPEDLTNRNLDILDPEFLVTTMLNTHNAIHYGDRSLLPRLNPDRSAGDTKLW